MSITPEELAGQMLEVVPAVMRAIRGEMRQHRGPDLTVPQYRTLACLDRYPGASLSDVAEYIGLSLPAMSKLVDGLLERRFVTRETCRDDRRRVNLALTVRGRAALQASLQLTQTYLADKLSQLPEAERARILHALELLGPLFRCEREAQDEGNRTVEFSA